MKTHLYKKVTISQKNVRNIVSSQLDFCIILCTFSYPRIEDCAKILMIGVRIFNAQIQVSMNYNTLRNLIYLSY